MKWEVKDDCLISGGWAEEFLPPEIPPLFVEEYLVQQKSWLVTLEKGIEHVFFFFRMLSISSLVP